MQVSTKVGLAVGLAAGAVVTGGLAMTLAAAREDDGPHVEPGPDGWSPVPQDPVLVDPYPVPVPTYPEPGGGTSPGDEPIAMPVRGFIDPPGLWNDYGIDGRLDGSRLDATIDPRGWWNDVHVSGRVDGGGFRTTVDPAGWGNDVQVRGTRSGNGFRGEVSRPGWFNDVDHRITETVQGAQLLRHGQFDEPLTPGFAEVEWESSPVGVGGGGRVLEFDPPGWGNTTRVDLEGNPPAGVEASVAAYLFDQWKLEQERQAEYPDPGYPDPTSPGDDPTGPTSPGDDGGSYPYPGGDYPDV